MRPPRKRRGPGKVTTPHQGPSVSSDTDTDSLQRGDRGGGICWRCGVPFAWTDMAALARCAELARQERAA